jgi:hypothetical protein
MSVEERVRAGQVDSAVRAANAAFGLFEPVPPDSRRQAAENRYLRLDRPRVPAILDSGAGAENCRAVRNSSR